jgi:hypothetical protein
MLTAFRKELRERGEYRFGRWGTFWHRFAVSRWRWSVALCKFEDHWALHFFCLWVTLWKTRTEPEEMMESWGFTLDPWEDRCLHLNWGSKVKIYWLPWHLDHCRHEVMLRDGRFVDAADMRDIEAYRVHPHRPMNPWSGDVGGELWVEAYPYRYTLRSGEAQERTATVTVERRTWWWKSFRWLGWPRKVRTAIDVKFSDEVGERTGSWKGGTIGCGYELQNGETPEQCLRRMEAEREFN